METTVAQAKTRTGLMKFILAWCATSLVVVGEVVGMLVAIVLGLDEDTGATLGGAVAGVTTLLLLGAKSHFRLDVKAIIDTFKYLWWIMLVTIVLMFWDFTDYITNDYAIDPNWFLTCLQYFVLCLAIGFSEECEFRGLMTGGTLARFGGSKRGVWISVLIGALVFGWAHISWGDLDFGDVYSVVQVLLKMLQTGMYAVMLTAVMLKTRSFIGIALFHAIDDYLLFVSSGIFGDPLVIEYVTTESTEEAIYTIWFYVIICALYLPTFIKSIRYIMKNVDVPEFGPLISEGDLLNPGQEQAGTWMEGYPQMRSMSPMGFYGGPAGAYPPQGSPFAAHPQFPVQPGAYGYGQQPYAQQPYAQPHGLVQQPLGYPQQPYTPQPYVQQPLGQQPYVQQPYVHQPYGQQPFAAQQPIAQQPYLPQPYGQQPYVQQLYPPQGYVQQLPVQQPPVQQPGEELPQQDGPHNG